MGKKVDKKWRFTRAVAEVDPAIKKKRIFQKDEEVPEGLLKNKDLLEHGYIAEVDVIVESDKAQEDQEAKNLKAKNKKLSDDLKAAQATIKELKKTGKAK